MDARDRLKLEDMLEHAQLAVSILGGADEAALAANAEKRLAVTRAVEVIGEAANQIDPVQRSRLPTLPWDQMRAMRNRIVHNYGRVDLGILVNTVRNHIPPLIAEIEQILNTGA